MINQCSPAGYFGILQWRASWWKREYWFSWYYRGDIFSLHIGKRPAGKTYSLWKVRSEGVLDCPGYTRLYSFGHLSLMMAPGAVILTKFFIIFGFVVAWDINRRMDGNKRGIAGWFRGINRSQVMQPSLRNPNFKGTLEHLQGIRVKMTHAQLEHIIRAADGFASLARACNFRFAEIT